MKIYEKHIAKEGKIIVTSRYKGKIFKGVAKCSPDDTYDEERGTSLATLRCKVKIAKKKVTIAQAAYLEAFEASKKADKKLQLATEYVGDAVAELSKLENDLNNYEASM